MKKGLLLVVPIPILFVVGLVFFFLLVPQDLATLSNFIDYSASLSTIIMVLVYIFTTSRQLNSMSKQLNEMQFSRNVQIQPLLYFDQMKMSIDAPRFYVSPETGFKKLHFKCRVHFGLNVSNIGNGPAVAVDFIPRLVQISSKEKKMTTLVEHEYEERIECISLRERDSKRVNFMFQDNEHRFIESVVGQDVFLHLQVAFKNALGMTFREEITFRVLVYDIDLADKLKTCLKVVRTSQLDFADRVADFEKQKALGKDAKAEKILESIKTDLKKQLSGLDAIEIATNVLIGSFSITPISQSEYERIMAEKERAILHRVI